MEGAKPITPPSSSHKVYGKVSEKYATPYFTKVLIAGNKIVRDLPKYGGNLQGKRDICMHHILAKIMNPNCNFYHAQSNELDAQYAANVCTVLALGMYYIWRHGSEEIQVPSTVGNKRKREN